MLPRSVGTVTNCSAVSLIVPYTLARRCGALGTDTADSGMATLARSSAVILIASLSFGLGIVPLLAAWIRRGRLAGIVCIRLGGGPQPATFRVLRFRYDLARLYIDQLAGSRIEEHRHDHHTREDIPGQMQTPAPRPPDKKRL